MRRAAQRCSRTGQRNNTCYTDSLYIHVVWLLAGLSYAILFVMDGLVLNWLLCYRNMDMLELIKNNFKAACRPWLSVLWYFSS